MLGCGKLLAQLVKLAGPCGELRRRTLVSGGELISESLLGLSDRRLRSLQLLLEFADPLPLLGGRVTKEFGLGSVGNLCVGPGLVGRGYRVPRGVQIPGQVR